MVFFSPDSLSFAGNPKVRSLHELPSPSATSCLHTNYRSYLPILEPINPYKKNIFVYNIIPINRLVHILSNETYVSKIIIKFNRRLKTLKK